MPKAPERGSGAGMAAGAPSVHHPTLPIGIPAIERDDSWADAEPPLSRTTRVLLL
jgi:hypothetical protein